MKKTKVKVYWLLLLTLMYTAGMVLAVGEAQARFDNTITESLVLDSQTVAGITSNCLISEAESPVTVLLGELPLERATRVSFWMHSADSNATGNLRWEVMDAESSNGTSHAEYLDITMYSGYEEIEPNAEIDLLENVRMDLTMVLRPTDIARNTEHEKLSITVLVSWGEDMWGTFQVLLPEKIEIIEETLPQQDSSEETSEETEEDLRDQSEDTEENAVNQSSEEEDWEEQSFHAEEEDQTNQSAETEEKQQEPSTDSETDQMNPGENPDNTAGDPEQDNQEQDNPENGEDQDAPDEKEDINESDENKGEDPDLSVPEGTIETQPLEEEQIKPIRMDMLSRFDPAGGLPVKLILTPDVTSVRLGLYSPKGETVSLAEPESEDFLGPFQDGTRFSLDGGECFYMLYKGSTLELTVQEMTSLTMLLDFTYTDLQKNKDLILVMEAYAGESLQACCIEVTVPDAPDAFQTAVLSREEIQKEEEAREESRADYQAADGIILNQNNALELLLPLEWQKMDVEYILERLTLNDYHMLTYVPVNVSGDAWEVEYINEDNKHYLTVHTGTALPQAGTYRLTIKWNYEEICYAQTQTTFFVNYSAKTNYQLTSSEVPEND